MLKILFMGTPDFARESLKAILEAGHVVEAVVTNPDKPKGRGMKMWASPVKEYAVEKQIEVWQPERVKNNEELLEKIRKIAPDVICVVAYGKILPKALLEIPKKGCINVHGSLLPKYRGAAPIQWAVLNGETTTGITTMYMDEGMDTGDMILKREVTIGKEETTGELWERLSTIGGEVLVETLKKIEEGTAPRTPQPADFTMAPMLKKEMAKIEWEEQTAEQIHNLVRGLNPIMGAYCFLLEKKIKLWKVKVVEETELLDTFEELSEYTGRLKKLTPGTVLFSDSKKGLYVKAKEGILQILEMQGENAKKMEAKQYLVGNPIMAGTVLE